MQARGHFAERDTRGSAMRRGWRGRHEPRPVRFVRPRAHQTSRPHPRRAPAQGHSRTAASASHERLRERCGQAGFSCNRRGGALTARAGGRGVSQVCGHLLTHLFWQTTSIIAYGHQVLQFQFFIITFRKSFKIFLLNQFLCFKQRDIRYQSFLLQKQF